MATSFRTNWVVFGDVVSDSSLSIGARLLLVVLLKYAGTNGRCFASQEVLAKDMGCSARTVRTYLNELKKAKQLAWRREGFNGPNIYSFPAELYSPLGQPAKTAHSGGLLPTDNGNPAPANNVSNHVNESSKLQQRFDTFTGKTLLRGEQLQFANLYEQLGAAVLDGAIEEAIRRGKSDINVGYLAQIAGDIKPPAPLFTPCGQDGCNDKGYVKTVDGMAECKCRTEFYGG